MATRQMTRELPTRIVDVLVVGGGLAAMEAAVTAAEAGAVTGVASKRRMGRSGSSAMTTGGYAAAMPDNPWLDEPQRHFEDTFDGGAGIADPELVKILCEEAPALVEELAGRGGGFRMEGARYVLSPSGDHSRARSLGAERHLGTAFTVPLAERAIELGVVAFEGCMVLDLLRRENAVVGALAIDTSSGEPLIIWSAATILATGGAGQLYPVTSNPQDVTGDGFSLAARAGALLRDMEFVQFYPWRCIDPFTKSRVAIQPGTFSVGGKLFNARAERFMVDYEPERLEATTRDISAIAIFDQMTRGLGVEGGVRLDLSDVTPDDMAETNPKVLRALERPAIDYRTYRFVVAPEAHYFMGGVAIDPNGSTSVARLYAVGECAGGIQGGNRLSNNALPEALVFGRRAGLHAAQVAMDTERRKPSSYATLPAIRSLSLALERGRSTAATPSRKDVQQVCADTLGIVRDLESLERGESSLHRLIERWDVTGPSSPKGAGEYFAVRSLLDTAVMTLCAATHRTESRGAHYRRDWPERDDEHWLGAIVLERGDDGSFKTDLIRQNYRTADHTS